MSIYHTQERGFVALMSVILICAVLLLAVFTLYISSFFARFDALDSENKRVSLGLAEACVNAATLRLAQASYAAGTIQVDNTIPFDPQKTCKICQITPTGLILTRAVYNGAYTNLQVMVDPTPGGTFPVTNWVEMSSGDPSCTVP